MGSKKTKTTSNETATTTPNAPSFYSGGVQNYYDKLNNSVGASDPQSFVTPINAIQQQALGQAGQFGGTSSLYGDAAGIAKSVAGAAGSYQPAQAATVAGVASPDLWTAQSAELPKAAQAALGGGLLGSQAPQAGGGIGGEIERASSQSLLDGLSKYMDPYTQRVVDTTMANFDDAAGRQQAAYAAQGAQNKAFGGSRYAIGEAQLGSDLARQRAATEAGLRSDAFTKGTELSNLDTARRQEAGLFNAGQKNDRDNLSGQLATQASIANAGNQNSRDISIAELAGQLGMFNAGQQNDMSMAGFNAANSNNQFNAGQANDLNAMIYQALTGNAQFNAGQANDMTKFNGSQQMQALQQQLAAAGMLNDTANSQGQQAIANNQQLLNLGNTQWGLQDKQTQAPLSYFQQMQQLLDPSLVAPMTGQTVTSNGTKTSKESGGMLGDLLGPLGQLGAAAITKSERRVKRDIELIGRESDSLGVYRYRYLWDDDAEPLRTGVMVDEVAAIRPWALGPVVDGVQTVNYGAL